VFNRGNKCGLQVRRLLQGKPKAQAGNVTIIRRGEGKAFQAEGSVERIQSAGNSK
jgi:hypothetical protein